MVNALCVSSTVINTFQKFNQSMPNLKLQKILYYIQIEHLKTYGIVAFTDDIEAWRNGPVVRKVYLTYKNYVGENINISDPAIKNNYIELDSELKNTIEKIVEKTLFIDTWDLVEKTLQTDLWKHYYKTSYSNVIPINALKLEEINI